MSNHTYRSETFRIVILFCLKEKCMKICHLSHFGIEKTFRLISEKYYWKGMFANVTKFVNSFTRRLAVKNQRIPKAPFQNSYQTRRILITRLY